MFTGLITDVGTIRVLDQRGDLRMRIATNYDTARIDIGASIACSGVCLTVVGKGDDWFDVDVSAETCRVTTLENWREGSLVNLESSLKLGDDMGGHIVSGHVDCVGDIVALEPEGDSVRMDIALTGDFGALIAPKGSIAVDGVSLTVNSVRDDAGKTTFSINLIPHTQAVTAFRAVKVGDRVNLECDMLARYVARLNNFGRAAG